MGMDNSVELAMANLDLNESVLEPVKIVGMGKVLVKQHNGNQWLLKEVRHVPDLKKIMISTGKLCGEGCVTTFTVERFVSSGSPQILSSISVSLLQALIYGLFHLVEGCQQFHLCQMRVQQVHLTPALFFAIRLQIQAHLAA